MLAKSWPTTVIGQKNLQKKFGQQRYFTCIELRKFLFHRKLKPNNSFSIICDKLWLELTTVAWIQHFWLFFGAFYTFVELRATKLKFLTRFLKKWTQSWPLAHTFSTEKLFLIIISTQVYWTFSTEKTSINLKLKRVA